jgi:hypothetical protein
MLRFTVEQDIPIEKALKKIDVLQVIYFITSAWEKTSQTTLKNCFYKALKSEAVIEQPEDVVAQDQIIEDFAKQLGTPVAEIVKMLEALELEETAITHEEISDDDIIELVTQADEDDSDSDVEEMDIVETKISLNEIKKSIGFATNGVQDHPEIFSLQEVLLLKGLEEKAERAMDSMKTQQTSMHDFFKPLKK